MNSVRTACFLALIALLATAGSGVANPVAAPTPTTPAAPLPVAVNLPAGDDGWTTTADGGTTLQYDLNPLPAGFFGIGSDVLTVPVNLTGRSIAQSGGMGTNIDTIVRRPVQTGYITQGTCTTIPADFKALHLESDTFPVTYNGGASSETWKIVAGLSTAVAQPMGDMTICNNCGTGGTFDANVKALFVLNYIRVSPAPAIQFQLDCGLGLCPEIQFSTSGAHWSLSSAIGSLNIDPLPPGVQIDVDADGILDPVTTIGKSSFQGAIKTCGTSGSGGGGGGAPECAVVEHVANNPGGDHSRSSHSNYAAGGDSNGDGLPDHCACEDANGDGIDDDGGGHPCPGGEEEEWEEADPRELDGRF